MPMKGIKKLIQRVFHLLGYKLSKFSKGQITNKRDQHFIKLLQKFEIDLILDVGAARGEYAEWIFNLGYSNTIISFEPLPVQYEILQKLTKLHPRLRLMGCFALGNKEGDVDIHISQNLASSSVLNMLGSHSTAAPQSKVVYKITVPIRKLDSFKDELKSTYSSIFLKIDVQGFEKSVLDGALLLMPFVKGLQIELSLISLYQEQVLYREMIDYVDSLGFKLYYLRPGFTDPGGRLLQVDGIFFRE